MKESAVQNHIRRDAAYFGDLLYRNNVGVAFDETGRAIRYGLCNESAELNKRIKSSDLIGPIRTLVTPQMVGCIVGIFGSIEVKETGWIFQPSDARAVAQKAFHDIILQQGGMAGFATCPEDYRRITWKL